MKGKWEFFYYYLQIFYKLKLLQNEKLKDRFQRFKEVIQELDNLSIFYLPGIWTQEKKHPFGLSPLLSSDEIHCRVDEMNEYESAH